MTICLVNSTSQDQVASKGKGLRKRIDLPVKLWPLQMVLATIALGSVLLFPAGGQALAKDDTPLSPEAKKVRAKLEKGLKNIDLTDEFAYYRLIRQSGFGVRQTLDARRTKFIINQDFSRYEVHFMDRKISYFQPLKN